MTQTQTHAQDTFRQYKAVMQSSILDIVGGWGGGCSASLAKNTGLVPPVGWHPLHGNPGSVPGQNMVLTSFLVLELTPQGTT